MFSGKSHTFLKCKRFVCIGVGPLPMRGSARQDKLCCILTINVGISGVNHSSTMTMLAATRQQLAVLA